MPPALPVAPALDTPAAGDRGEGTLRVEPFGAIIGRGVLHVHGRVHSGALPAPDPRGLRERARTLWRRWESDEVPGVTVRVTACGATTSGRTDDEGYFAIRLALEDAALAPSTPVAIAAVGGPTCVVNAVVAGRDARFVVVSDVDDTVLVADATRRLRQAVNLYLREAGERRPVEGMARLYRALARGDGETPRHNPIAYVSSAPANLVTVMRDALARNGFPAGPLHLPDVGIDDQKLIKAGHLEHKSSCIAKVLDAVPDLPAVLVGDTGQADPEVFERVALKHPQRVRAAFLRDAPGGDAARADASIARLKEQGVLAARFSRPEVVQDELAALGWAPRAGAR